MPCGGGGIAAAVPVAGSGAAAAPAVAEAKKEEKVEEKEESDDVRSIVFCVTLFFCSWYPVDLVSKLHRFRESACPFLSQYYVCICSKLYSCFPFWFSAEAMKITCCVEIEMQINTSLLYRYLILPFF